MKTTKKFLKIFCLFILVSAMLCPAALATGDFSVSCRSAILVDVNTGQVIYEQNADSKQYPASITKLMTALLVYENADFNDVVTVTESALAGLDEAGSSVSLEAGERMTVENLMYCMLVSSGNDAANVLAEFTAGSVSAFVDMMNAHAEKLGCTGTHYTNPHGLHNDNHYTTARDLYIIAREFVSNPALMQIANTVSYVVPETNKSSERILNTTNYLISGVTTSKYIYTYARGIKTGTTTPAGYCLVSSAEKNGLYLVSVVLGCGKDEESGEIMSFVETKRMFEYGFNNFSYKELVGKNQPVVELPVDMSQEAENVVAVTQEGVSALLDNGFDSTKVVLTPWMYSESLTAPVIKGQLLGEVDVSYNGVSYGRVKLVALTGVERSNFLYSMDRMNEAIRQPKYIVIAAVIAAVIVIYIIVLLILKRRKRLRKLKKGRYIF
ncbi:MAG: D-alanyl-D-alanine carboxypeptidase [Clostridiales bacterium]|nr:D-alanyl-D-alanine carboxypeptidase [Clostridiales bacterium]